MEDLNPSLAEHLVVLLPEQEQQVAMVSHLASYSDMLVAVVGPTASGKTTLAFELMKQHINTEDTLYIAADIMFGIPSLLRRIGDIDQLQLPEARGQAIDLLKAYADARTIEGRTLLVVIDQAEQLDVDTLNEIAHLALLIPKGISFVLFGNTGFEKNFRRGPAQASVHVQPLMPLSEESAQQLLQRVYSPSKTLPLSQTELVYLHRQSGGWPGSLIVQASEYFQDANPKRKKTKQANEPKKKFFEGIPLAHILALLLLAGALLLSYWYQPQESDQTSIPEQEEPLEDVLRGLPLPMDFEEAAQLLDVPEVKTVEVDYNFTENEAVTVNNDVVELEATSIETIAEIVPKTATEKKPQPIITPNVASTKIKNTDAEKLLAAKQGAIIQLFGSYEKNNADKFVEKWRSHIKSTFYQYQTKNKGKDWHVVVVGIYTNKAEAQKAIQSWPAKLKAEKPWVRDIKDVHQALK